MGVEKQSHRTIKHVLARNKRDTAKKRKVRMLADLSASSIDCHAFLDLQKCDQESFRVSFTNPAFPYFILGALLTLSHPCIFPNRQHGIEHSHGAV